MIYLRILLAIILIQWLFFCFANYFKTDKVTDLAYWMTFAGIALWLLFFKAQTDFHVLLSLIVMIRWVRLAGYLFIRILAIWKDERFDQMRQKTRSFMKFRILQTIAIFVLLLPVVQVYTKSVLPIGMVTIIWALIAVIWIIIESIADQQKFAFKRQNPTKRINVWLRKKARHPNYFGEILVRRGIFLMCVPFLSWREYISIISPISITCLLLFVSGVPLLKVQWDKKYGDDKEYQEWKEDTNLLWPF